MQYILIRYILITVFLGLGLFFHLKLGLAQAWYLYAAAALLLLTQILFGGIWIAFGKLHRGDIAGAGKILDRVIKPAWLIRRNRAYYHFIKGMIFLQGKALPEGKTHLEKALAMGLQRDNDKALAALNLAHIYFVEHNYQIAGRFLEKSRSYGPTDLMIKDKLQKLEQALQQKLL